MNTIADTIKRTLSMYDVAVMYGFTPNRSGNIKCPFHAEKTPSLKIYKEPGRGFYCYGCGAGSTVIDFVMKLFNISFQAAVVRLNADFKLGLLNERPDPKALEERRRRMKEIEKACAAFTAEWDKKMLEHRRLWYAKIHKAPSSPDEEFDPEYVEACQKLDMLEYWFETHPYTEGILSIRGENH